MGTRKFFNNSSVATLFTKKNAFASCMACNRNPPKHMEENQILKALLFTTISFNPGPCNIACVTDYNKKGGEKPMAQSNRLFPTERLEL